MVAALGNDLHFLKILLLKARNLNQKQAQKLCTLIVAQIESNLKTILDTFQKKNLNNYSDQHWQSVHAEESDKLSLEIPYCFTSLMWY
jgi:hypothetical protein